MKIRLTEYSHGAGCGCKISPQVLDLILKSQRETVVYSGLVVGNESKDDAAVFDLGNGTGVVSTTDFFMPIVDDPFTFGRIAATNAISDVYAMGGHPLLAVAILGWPVNTLGPDIAQQVVEGGRAACQHAGIPLAGGHSIDTPEPIFGLAVTGLVTLSQLKRNDKAKVHSRLYLTKPLGIGILTTAQKKKKLLPEHESIAIEAMCQLNTFGAHAATLAAVNAMTDVTGFGLLGHLLELCEGSKLAAELWLDRIPLLPQVERYRAEGCIPGGTERNFQSYGDKVATLDERYRQLLCDPQTSGGLLISVSPDGEAAFLALARTHGFVLEAIGELRPHVDGDYWIKYTEH